MKHDPGMVTGVSGMLSSDETAHEIWASLEQGDHLRHSKQLLRAIFTLVMLLLLAFRPGSRRHPRLPLTDAVLVLANPVAHGARLGSAICSAFPKGGIGVVVDERLASLPVSHPQLSFPSLGIRSFSGLVTPAMVGRAVALRSRLRGAAAVPRDLNAAYCEALFLIQAVRYDLALRMIGRAGSPLILVTDFDKAAYARPLIWAANQMGHPTASLVHGSPSQAYLPVVAQNMMVWGEAQREWFARHAPECRLHVVGRVDFDRKALIAAEPKVLRIVHSREDLSVGEASRLRALVSAAHEFGWEVTLRLHPSASRRLVDGAWRWFLDRVTSEDPSEDFVGSLRQGDVVCGIVSTALVDAVTAGVPALTVADEERELPCDLQLLRPFRDDADPRAGLLQASPAASMLRGRLIAAVGSEARENLALALLKLRGSNTTSLMQR